MLTAVLWVVIGVALAWVSAQAGMPTASGWLALLSGPIALVVVGRRSQLRGLGDWVMATVIAIVAVMAVGGAGIFIWTILAYG